MATNVISRTEVEPAHVATSQETSRHKCLVYEGEVSKQLPVVVPFFRDGLRENWRCAYFASPESLQMLDAALEDHGVNVRQEAARGALMLTPDRNHLQDGAFEPDRMVHAVSSLVDRAVTDGFGGLCASGDMRWELGADKNFDRLAEYEARLEPLFHEKPLRGICLYHRDILPAQAVRDALITHRSAFIGGILSDDNLFYLPPDLVLENDNSSRTTKQGEWMCQQIIRVIKAEQKRDEALAALKSSQTELEVLNRDLERRVKERTAELESFSYSVSHDLRAPLRSIRGFSDILAEECASALNDEGRKHLNRVRSSARHMGELIDGLLTLARVVRQEARATELDLGEMAQDIARELHESAPERAAEFRIAKALRCTGDRVLVRAALTNLLGNAWKFTSKRDVAEIEVGETKDDSGQQAFFIKDNGAGFDMRYAKSLFNVFQRLHSAEDFAGTGIGLATVQRIIAKHGGRIWAEGYPNQGATFFFTLGSNF